MSDFLVNLARRGAGLAPVVRARLQPVGAIDGEATPIASDLEPGRIDEPSLPAAPHMPAPLVVSREIRTAEAAAPHVPARVVAPLAADVTAAAPVPAVQRTPTASAMPVSTLGPPFGSPRAPIVEAVADVRPSPAPHLPASAIDVAPTLAPTPVRTPIAITVDVEQPAAAPLLSVASDAPRRVAEPATSFESRPASDRVAIDTRPKFAAVERADTIALPAPPPVPALASTLATPLVRDADGPPDRVVHVRIGAIEIHGPAPAPAVAPPPSRPASPRAESSAGAFDRFTRLRSYAPWDW